MTTVYGPELGLAYKTCTMTEAGQHMSLDKPVTTTSGNYPATGIVSK